MTGGIDFSFLLSAGVAGTLCLLLSRREHLAPAAQAPAEARTAEDAPDSEPDAAVAPAG